MYYLSQKLVPPVVSSVSAPVIVRTSDVDPDPGLEPLNPDPESAYFADPSFFLGKPQKIPPLMAGSLRGGRGKGRAIKEKRTFKTFFFILLK